MYWRMTLEDARANEAVFVAAVADLADVQEEYVEVAISAARRRLARLPSALVGSAARMRVTALETVILLSFYDGIAGLYAYALDPAAPATAWPARRSGVACASPAMFTQRSHAPSRGSYT